MFGIDIDNILILANSVVLLAVAIIAWKTRKDVAVVHKATNSLTERLVASTADKEFAAGKEAGRSEEREKGKKSHGRNR